MPVRGLLRGDRRLWTDAFTPGGGAHYTEVGLAAGLDAISCSSSRLCVAVAGGINAQNPGGGIWSSTNPATAHPHWHLVHAEGNEELAVACHARALCLAVDVDGRASAILDPAAAHPDLTTEVIDPEAAFTGVSCRTSRACIVVDRNGRMRIARR